MMVASLFYLSLSLSLILTLSSAAHHKPPHSPSKPPANPAVTAASPAIEQACAATLFPQQCEASLSQSQNLPPNPNPTPLQLLQSAIALSSDNLATAQTMVKSLHDASAASTLFSRLLTFLSLFTLNAFAKLAADDFAVDTPSWSCSFFAFSDSYSFPSSPS